MKTSENNDYLKCTQKDHSLSFKLEVVQEIEQEFLTRSQAGSIITGWLKKYANFVWQQQLHTSDLKFQINIF